MIYRCKVVDENKNIIEEKIEATSKKEVLLVLKNRNLKPIKIEEESYSQLELKIFKKTFNSRDIQLLLYQLYIMSKSNITIPNSIEILSKQYIKEKKKVLEEINEDLNSGHSLSDSMRRTKLFPNIVLNMIKVGENSSNMTNVLKNLSDYYMEENLLNKRVQNALIYPFILIFITIVIVNFLIFNIVPAFVEIFNSSGTVLPLSTRILIKVTTIINKNFVLITISLLMGILIIVLYFKTSKGKKKLDYIKLKNSYYKMVVAKQIINMMYYLISSKLTISASLEIIESSVNNIVLKEHLSMSLTKLKNGENFSNTLKNYGIFPDIVISMVAVSEESANLEEILNTLNGYYENELKIKEEKFIALLEPVTIIVLSLIIGFIVISIATPMFDITNRI